MTLGNCGIVWTLADQMKQAWVKEINYHDFLDMAQKAQTPSGLAKDIALETKKRMNQKNIPIKKDDVLAPEVRCHNNVESFYFITNYEPDDSCLDNINPDYDEGPRLIINLDPYNKIFSVDISPQPLTITQL